MHGTTSHSTPASTFSGSTFSRFSAWALSFGCAIGWGAFAMPGNVFLPGAGPLGSFVGMCVGALAMVVIAWNCHCMIREYPGPGGSFSFVERAFGSDHGFLAAWFLLLTSLAVLWANATALVFVIRCVFGDNLHFGFHYGIGDSEIYLSETAICIAAVFAATGLCLLRKRLAAKALPFLATVAIAGATLSLAAVLAKHRGGLDAMAPLFSATPGHTPLYGTMRIVAMAPWAFVGFEAVSHLSGEFAFPRRRSFGVMVSAIAAATLMYVMLAMVPALFFPDGFSGWPDYVAANHIADGVPQLHVFVSVRAALGKVGTVLIVSAMLGAISTTLVGNTLVLGRLMHSMQRGGALPGWFGRLNRYGEPANAMLCVAAVSAAVAFLGRTIIVSIVDVASIGAAIAYGYMSAAACKSKRRVTRATGFLGIALSLAFLLLLLVPNYLSGSMLAPDSYLILAGWCCAGFVHFRFVFKDDRRNRFGQSTVVWVSTLALVYFTAMMWLHETSMLTNENAFANIAAIASDAAASNRPVGELASSLEREVLPAQLAAVNRSLVIKGLVLTGLVAMSTIMLLDLYSILRKREQKLGREKLGAHKYFISTISHDIRTPLNAIMGFSQTMKDGFAADDERRKTADSILGSAQTLLRLMDDLIDLSALEAGRLETVAEPTDVARLVTEALEPFKAAAAVKKLAFRSSISAIPPLEIDRKRLRQIIANLVGNAVKFTDSGSVETTVAYLPDGDARTGSLTLKVEDTGPGISEEDRHRIASPFVQLSSSASRNKGTGVGLAITRNLVSAMNGELLVDSTPGKGSVFTVRLNGVRQAAKAALAPGRTPAAPPAPAGPASATVSAREKTPRVLVVDDVKLNLLVIKTLLAKLGIQDIATAMNGQEALAVLRGDEKPVDIVLTDIWMPVLDGVGLLKAIRADDKFASIPVFAVTADVEMTKKYQEFGFAGLFLKPVSAENLQTALR